MKKLLTAVILSTISITAAAEVSVIVHPSNANALDASSISRIYLGKSKSFPDGNQVVPIAQADDSAVTQEFNDKVLKKSQGQIKAYWSKLIFTGKGTPPKKAENDAKVLELVSANPSIIGFVSSESVTADVKVVGKF